MYDDKYRRTRHTSRCVQHIILAVKCAARELGHTRHAQRAGIAQSFSQLTKHRVLHRNAQSLVDHNTSMWV
jgi:hypothetical protein